MKTIYRLLTLVSILMLISGIVAAIPNAPAGIPTGIPDVPTGIPTNQNAKIPAPTTPEGFTNQQIQSAKDILATNNFSKPTLTNGLAKRQGIVYGGPTNMYAIVPSIDSKYTVFQTNLGGNINIPLKTEIWDSNFRPVTASNGFVGHQLLYWNYFTRRWSYWYVDYKYTDTNGIVGEGFSIPYQLSDKFMLNGQDWEWNGNTWIHFQSYSKLFTVSWY